MTGHRKPSLRNILLLTFIPLSVGPLLAAMTWSFYAYRQGMKTEILRRGKLEIGQFRQVLFSQRLEVETGTLIRARSPSLLASALSGNGDSVRGQLEILRSISSIGFNAMYFRSGNLWVRTGNGPVLESGEVHERTKMKKSQAFFGQIKSGELVLYSVEPVVSLVGKTVAYYQEGVVLDSAWFKAQSAKLSDNLIILGPAGKLLGSTFSTALKMRFENLSVRLPPSEEPIQWNGFMIQFQSIPGVDGRPVAYVGVAESMEGVNEILQANNDWILFVSALAIVIVMLIVVIATRRILRPLKDLVRASEDLKAGHHVDDLPEAVSAEIEDLREAFLEMAHSVTATKEMLEVKLIELQDANNSIRNAQGQVVQSAKMAGLGQLVAGIAHELNNPIGFIHANMFHLKEYSVTLFKYIAALENQANLPELRKKMEIEYIRKDLFDLIKSCREGAQRTKDIVQGLKTFSRLDEAQLKEIDVQDGIKSTLQILRSELKNTKVNVRFQESFPRITCYASQINQVWLNLILNAAQSMNPKGGEIDIEGTTDGDLVTVLIRDHGSGIEPENLDKIFEPFFTTKDIGKGTGLGLSICYNIIQKHGGTISVQSQVGIGTTFLVTLPKQPSEQDRTVSY